MYAGLFVGYANMCACLHVSYVTGLCTFYSA